MTSTGEWEIWSVSRRLLDSPGELAYMYVHGVKVGENVKLCISES